ncbi:MAG: oligosaccharide flippase family protein [Spirochaetes bacterium]|nr:oligosaccharide flippase family protein [Spirochaetota bacterium]
MSTGRKIISNTIYNFIGRAFGLLTTIILTPFIIKKIGVELFGIYAILFVLAGYLRLFDFGIRWAFIKYTAEYNQKHDFKAINQMVASGIFFYLLVFSLIYVLAAVFKGPVISFFRLSPGLEQKFNSVYHLALLSFVLVNIFSVFIHIPLGLQRMDLSNKINILCGFLTFAGTVVLLSLGWGLKGLVITSLAVNIVMIVVSFIVSKSLLPSLQVHPAYIDRRELKKIFSFGIKNQLGSMPEIVSFQTDKFIIGKFLSMAFVSFYEVGTRVLHQIRYITSLLISAVVPAVSELKAKKDMKKIFRLYDLANKYIVTIIVPLLFLVNIFARDLLLVWVGPSLLSSASVFYILSLGYFFNCLGGVAYVMAIGMGRPDINMRFGVFDTIVNLSLSITLVILFQFPGILVGTSLALIASTIYLLVLFHQFIKIDPVRFWSKILLKPILTALIAGILIVLADRVMGGGHSRIIMALGLFGKSIFFLSVYSLLLFLFKYYKVAEVKTFLAYFKK